MAAFGGLFKRREALVSIDIGSSAIKLLEVDKTHDRPELVNIGIAPLTGEVYTNNVISKPEKVAEQLIALLESNAISDKRVVTAVPGPSVFTKKIKIAKMSMEEIAANIQFEAGSYIPHNIDAVRLDFHIIGESGKNQLDVLVVAVKNEIIDSLLNCVAMAGLETAVVDVDYFALQNMFELAYPEDLEKTVALINMGARYSSINICKGGQSLFTGDIPVGGKLFSDALVTELGIPSEEVEKAKQEASRPGADPRLQEVFDKNVEYAATEFNRQLSFFWNASGAEEGIDKIVLSGGGALVPGLSPEIAEKTGIECVNCDPLRGFSVGSGFEEQYLKELGPMMAVCAGMAVREPGDRVVPEL